MLALVTVDYGTALAPIFTAHAAGKRLHVFADETRPLLQGARLTAWELQQRGIPVTLICDSMAAQVMREGKVQAVLVGADRIAANGDTANKIGTYGVALLAAAHDIPFYVVAPSSTFDLSIQNGEQIPIEQRPAVEITHGFGRQTAPAGIDVYNPAFDVTSAKLISGIVCEHGIVAPVDEDHIARMIRPGVDAVHAEHSSPELCESPEVMSKPMIRRRMRGTRDAMSEQQIAAASAIIVARLLGLEAIRDARTWFTYVSAGSEVSTAPLVKLLLQTNFTVNVPRVVQPGQMIAQQIHSWEELQPAAFGFLEPIGEIDVFEDSIDVCVCPGLAFTQRGERLGSGGGFYDRYLATNPPKLSVGLAFECQIVEELPMIAHDRSMDLIVTEKRTIHVDRASR